MYTEPEPNGSSENVCDTQTRSRPAYQSEDLPSPLPVDPPLHLSPRAALAAEAGDRNRFALAVRLQADPEPIVHELLNNIADEFSSFPTDHVQARRAAYGTHLNLSKLPRLSLVEEHTYRKARTLLERWAPRGVWRADLDVFGTVGQDCLPFVRFRISAATWEYEHPERDRLFGSGLLTLRAAMLGKPLDEVVAAAAKHFGLLAGAA